MLSPDFTAERSLHLNVGLQFSNGASPVFVISFKPRGVQFCARANEPRDHFVVVSAFGRSGPTAPPIQRPLEGRSSEGLVLCIDWRAALQQQPDRAHVAAERGPVKTRLSIVWELLAWFDASLQEK